MATQTAPAKIRRAIAKYGESVCIAAYRHHELGNGASTVSWEVSGIKQGCTRQADAAIDAGRWLARGN